MRKVGSYKGKINKRSWIAWGYCLAVIAAGLYVIVKSVGICVEMADRQAYHTHLLSGINSTIAVMFEQVFPNLYYEDQYGEGMTYVYENEIPDSFYEDEDTKSPEAVMALEAGEQQRKQEAQEPQEVPVSPVMAGGKGTTYTDKQLHDYEFLYQNFYVVDSTTTLEKNELDGKRLLSQDLSVDLDTDDYKILIYHTHGSEAFTDSRENEVADTIIGVGDVLAEVLTRKYGISVYHDRSVYDMVDGKLDRSYAYTLSKKGVKKILKKHPEIEVIIDLHRDGVAESTHLVTQIQGKPTAKVMFLNGMSRSKKNGDISYLSNPYKETNLAFSLQMYVAGKAMYGDFLRKIYIRSYCYNLNLMPRATLIEAGAQTNTVEEEKNAMEPLADILYQVLSRD